MKSPRVKILPVALAYKVNGNLPSFSRTGSITGMRRLYYGPAALLVRCGSWIYDVTSRPDIYTRLAH